MKGLGSREERFLVPVAPETPTHANLYVPRVAPLSQKYGPCWLKKI